MLYPVSAIHYDRPTRQRHELGDLEGLKKSLRELGQFHPIIITSEGVLISGERRLTAAKELGWSHIEVKIKEELSDLEKERIEHDENFHRLNLSWQEHALAVLKFHELSTQIEGDEWTNEQSADLLGVDVRTVYRQLRVARALREGDPLVVAAPVFSTAYGICERRDARKGNEEQEALAAVIRAPVRIRVAGEVLPIPEPAPEVFHLPILNTDFIQWAQSYTGPKFNLLHCDFPYGIDAGDHDQGAGKAFGGYEDDAEVYWRLINALNLYRNNFIAESAHMIFWYSPKYHEDTMQALIMQDWHVNPYPLIWHRSDNSGILPDPRRSPRQVYETAFLCTRGDRFLFRAKSNLVASPNTKQYHMSEKPLPVLRHFLEMLVDETTTLLDPTCGSANSLIAGRGLGARTVLGIEKSPDFYGNAVRNWKENGNG